MSNAQELFSASLIEKNFVKILSNPDIKVVSFDIFDTLFFRTCQTPSDVFTTMGEQEEILSKFDTASSFANYRKNAANSAKRANSHKEEISLCDIYAQLPLSEEESQKFQAIELAVEQELLFVNVQVERWIEFAIKANKRVILTSDMYLNYEQINAIALNKLSPKDKVEKVFISSEYNVTKASGKLYLQIFKELNIKANELLHIGDNERSDIAVAKNIGVYTLYYGASKEQKYKHKYENLYMQEPLKDSQQLRYLASLQNPYENELEKFYFDVGASTFGPLLWEFTHWLAQMSQMHNRDKLVFIMREGALFEKCLKELYPEIKTTLLYASRKSTHFLTLNAEDFGSINFSMYKNFTLKDLYASFFIEPKDPLVLENMQRLCEDLQDILVNEESLLNLVKQDLEKQKEQIQNALTHQHKLLAEYLQSQTINANNALIDFGGGGTVIKRLSEFLEKEQSPQTNFLLYQHAQSYNTLLGLHTLAFLPLTKKTARSLSALQQTPAFIEILLNGIHPTTQCYEKKDEKINAKTYLPKSNQLNITRITTPFQSGLKLFFTLAKEFKLSPRSYDRESLALLLARAIELPTPQESKYFGTLEYDEGKASEHYYTLVDKTHLESLKEQNLEKFYKDFLTNPVKYKQQFPWIQGAITELSPQLISSFYRADTNPNQVVINRILEKLDASEEKKIMVYGAGELFIQLLPHLQERSIEIEAVIDSRAEVNSFKVKKYEAVSLSEAFKNKSKVCLVIASGVYFEEIKKAVVNHSSQRNCIIDFI